LLIRLIEILKYEHTISSNMYLIKSDSIILYHI